MLCVKYVPVISNQSCSSTAETPEGAQTRTLDIGLTCGVFILRCDGRCHCSTDPPWRASDDEGCLVYSWHCGRTVYCGHVCPQWEVPQHGRAAGCWLWGGVCLISGLVLVIFKYLSKKWDYNRNGYSTCVALTGLLGFFSVVLAVTP